MTEVNSLTESQHRDVIGQPPGVKPRVPDHPPHRVLLVLHQLRPLEGARIVLTHPDLEAPKEENLIVCTLNKRLCLPSNILQVVCGRDDLGGPRAQAVAGGLRDDGAAPHEVVVLVEDQTRPGELPRGGLAMREAGHGT